MTEAVLEFVRLALSASLAAAGAALLLGGSIGLVRLPDVYTRAHGVRAADGAGLALMSVSLAVLAWDPAISARLLVLAGLATVSSALIAHLAAASARASDVTPYAHRIGSIE